MVYHGISYYVLKEAELLTCLFHTIFVASLFFYITKTCIEIEIIANKTLKFLVLYKQNKKIEISELYREFFVLLNKNIEKWR